MPIKSGNSVFSSGPAITQAVPVAQRTPTIPTEYGIPKMSMDSMFGSIDPRVSEVPEFHPGMDSMEDSKVEGNLPAHDDGDMSSMSEDAEDKNPVTPFHDVVRNHGGHYTGHTREGKHGEIRKNNYSIPNPKGGEEKVELHAHQGGHDYGNVNSITHSGDPEATAPRVNNSPEKLDRNIHAQSYRGAPDRPAKMKPAEVRENRKKLEE